MVDQYEGSRPRAKRGFAAMDPQKQREIASLGGRAAHQSGHAHQFNAEEARAAGIKRHQKPQPMDGGAVEVPGQEAGASAPLSIKP